MEFHKSFSLCDRSVATQRLLSQRSRRRVFESILLYLLYFIWVYFGSIFCPKTDFLEQALRHQRAAIKLAPDRGDYHYYLGELHVGPIADEQSIHRFASTVRLQLFRNILGALVIANQAPDASKCESNWLKNLTTRQS